MSILYSVYWASGRPPPLPLRVRPIIFISDFNRLVLSSILRQPIILNINHKMKLTEVLDQELESITKELGGEITHLTTLDHAGNCSKKIVIEYDKTGK